jgi:hypothetical protein
MIWSRMWWVAALWQLLCLLVVVWFFLQWLFQPGNPLRHEFGIGAAMALVYSAPAMVGLLILAIPRFGLGRAQRFSGLALIAAILACVGTFDAMVASGATQLGAQHGRGEAPRPLALR